MFNGFSLQLGDHLFVSIGNVAAAARSMRRRCRRLDIDYAHAT